MNEFEMPVQSIPKDKRFCKRCGEIKKLKYFKDGGEYCDACLNKMLHTHPKWYAYPVLFIVLVFAVASVWVAVITVPAAKCVFESRGFAEEHRLYDAYDKLEEAQLLMSQRDKALTERLPRTASFNWFSAGFGTWVSRCELMAETDTRLETGYAVKEDLNTDSLTKGQLKYLQGYLDICGIYEDISNKLGKLTEEYEIASPADVPHEELFKKLDEIAADNPSDEKSGYVEYYKASVMQYAREGDFEDSLPHLEKMIALLPDEFHMYISTLYEHGKKTGDYKKLLEECDKVIAKNSNFISAYSIKARALINSGDYKAAEAVCGELKKNNSDCPEYYALMIIGKLRQKDIEGAETISYQGDTANSEFVDSVFKQYLSVKDKMPRQSENIFLQSFDFTMSQAAVMLLLKDYSGARDLMYDYGYTYAYYYSYITGGREPMTQGLIDMTYLSAYLDGDKEATATVKEQLGEPSGTVQQIIDKKLTLLEVFVEGKVELF